MDSSTIAFQSCSVAYAAMQHEEFESNKIPLNGNTLKFITPRPTVKSEDELKTMTPWE